MPRAPLTYRLTADLEAAHAGASVVCLAPQAIGQVYRLHAGAPDRVPSSLRYVPSRDLVRAADMGDPLGIYGDASDASDPGPLLARVHISGPLESVCGYQGECGGWCDGYGGEGGVIARMRAALADADVLLTCDSPGGSVVGLPECVAAILAVKAEHGRRIFVVVTGWAASAMYWIASAVADPGELYSTTSSQSGNVGARAAHANLAGSLAQQGVEITDWAYPPGKIALSPNRAPTEAGVARGKRDVMAAFEMFAAAVTAARPTLTREAIVALDGDLLSGVDALRANLVDAIATVEDVETWALAGAAPGEESMSVRAEGEEPGKDPPPSKPGGRAEGEEKPDKMGCAKCGEDKPNDDARHCSRCGTKFPDPNEEPATSSKDPDALAARGVGAGTSLAGRYAAMSLPALRTAAVGMHRLLDAVAGLVDAKAHHEIKGCVGAVADDARKAERYRAERNAQRDANAKRERMDHLNALDAAGIHPHGELLVPEFDAAGKPTGKNLPAPVGIAALPLADLRAYARTKLAGRAPSAEASPYKPHEPDPARSQELPIAAEIEAAKKEPAVLIAARTSTRPIDEIAREYVATNRAARAQQGAPS